jgi:hypothetical protein
MDIIQNLYLERAKESYKRLKQSKSLFGNEQGLMEAVTIVFALLMIVIVGAIGIFIADRTLTAIGVPTDGNMSNMTMNATLRGSLTNYIGSAQTGSGFIVILVIAFIGGIAISYMFNMLGKNKAV